MRDHSDKAAEFFAACTPIPSGSGREQGSDGAGGHAGGCPHRRKGAIARGPGLRRQQQRRLCGVPEEGRRHGQRPVREVPHGALLELGGLGPGGMGLAALVCCATGALVVTAFDFGGLWGACGRFLSEPLLSASVRALFSLTRNPWSDSGSRNTGMQPAFSGFVSHGSRPEFSAPVLRRRQPEYSSQAALSSL